MRPKRLGSAVPIGGNIPIIGKPKPNPKLLPRFSAEQLESFLFDIAFGFCERITALEMQIETLAQEHGIELTLEEGEYKTRFETNLPQIMASFGFDPNQGPEVDEQGVTDVQE